VEKTHKNQKQKQGEDPGQANPLEFKIDPSQVGSDMLYPCCINGNCALFFYYEEEWRKLQKLKKDSKKPQKESEGEE